MPLKLQWGPMRIPQGAIALALGAAALLGQDAGEERRRQDLAFLLEQLPPTNENITGRINAFDENWREWQERTRELPPDFASMPSIPELPEPLVIAENGESTAIESEEQWRRRREQIRQEFERWIYGSVPPAPDNLEAKVLDERQEGDVVIRRVLLEFGPDRKAKLNLELLIPPGEGPFPVFLTNHARTRPWVLTAVRRGYLGCVYFAADPRYGYPDDSESYIEAYPQHDFSTIARWGWSASRAVDYLTTLPEVQADQIALTGHSRNGKQALFAAAFDERIAAVVPSSGNTGEGNPWRYTTDPFRNETIEQITGNFPHWFHPRLRFFVGREHKLPVDQNLLMALVAPRGLMLATAYSEHQGNHFGFEQAYRSVREVYRFLDAEDRLALYFRPGVHATTAGVIEDYLDFFDSVFGRGDFAPPEHWIHGYTFAEWADLSGQEHDPELFPEREASQPLIFSDGRKAETLEDLEDRREEVRERIAWSLGDAPPAATFPAREALDGTGMASDGWLGDLHGRPLELKGGGATEIPFGDDLQGDLYYPGGDGRPAAQKLPVVIWLHAFAYPTGYSRYAQAPFEELVRRGFAVFAFDQIGFGTRVLDGGIRFYERYPGWSLLGKMVADTRAAIDAMAALGETGVVDPRRIYLVGYSLGGKVALWTAAVDERPAAVAAVNAFTPLRLATSEKGIEGVAQYSELHGLIPRFGFFLDLPGRLPVDYDELLAAIAPRPALIVAATHDRYHPTGDVRAAVEGARETYRLQGAADDLTLETPADFNRFGPERQKQAFDWLEAVVSRPPAP